MVQQQSDKPLCRNEFDIMLDCFKFAPALSIREGHARARVSLNKKIYSYTFSIYTVYGVLLSAAMSPASAGTATTPTLYLERKREREGGRQIKREGCTVYVLAMNKDDFSSFRSRNLAECSGAQS